jgi:hypothetical protein
MVDNFALAISHGLLLLVAWRLFTMRQLDDEKVAADDRPTGWLKRSRRDA